MPLRVDVKGVKHVESVLDSLAAETVLDEIDSKLKQAGDRIARAAKTRVPDDGLSGWGRWRERRGTRYSSSGRVSGIFKNLDYSRSKIQRGIQTRIRNRKRSKSKADFAAYVIQKDAAGAIYELAGSVNDRSGQLVGGSALFGQNINRKRGEFYPRILGPAYDSQADNSMNLIKQAVDIATAHAQRELDKGGN